MQLPSRECKSWPEGTCQSCKCPSLVPVANRSPALRECTSSLDQFSKYISLRHKLRLRVEIERDDNRIELHFGQQIG